MRIYTSCLEMHSEVKRDLHEMGTVVWPETMQDKVVARDPAFKTLELSPCDFTILDGSDRDRMLASLGLSISWAKAEIEERWYGRYGVKGINPGDAWRLRRSVWEEFLHQGQFAYTYSERFARGGNLARVLHELAIRPSTRQAVLPVFNADEDVKNMGGHARVPCSLTYQFLIRDRKLRVVYSMRSSDFITHFPYDIWLALELQDRVAHALAIPPERLIFFTGSLHIYAKDADPGVF